MCEAQKKTIQTIDIKEKIREKSELYLCKVCNCRLVG